ncbi:alpha/beta-hydrolase [Periconia macrospinosa]|uniref:Alpha/beta-hydrolase n=1 Tax=Periconia macrospinosa TaxID=97972 RepID=A0A2V1D2P9_9PLEO|nr:alpha/beta-hydrolase [Periconia macrospinosa]
MTTYHTINIEGGVNVFYRAAGSPSSPTIVLFHGFPASSHQYRNFIPLLATKFRVVAFDLPGFGYTTAPARYKYTFEALTDTTQKFFEALNITHCSAYIFDYGAPVAYRLASEGRIKFDAIISQNANAYEQGFGHPFWDPLMAFWERGDDLDARKGLRDAVISLDFFKYHYTDGVPEEVMKHFSPDGFTFDFLLASRPGYADIQVDLLYDYRNNVKLYPKFQEYFRNSKVPLLLVWGKNDAAFIPAGAEAHKKDRPDVTIELLDTGHYVLETHAKEVAELALSFLSKHV